MAASPVPALAGTKRIESMRKSLQRLQTAASLAHGHKLVEERIQLIQQQLQASPFVMPEGFDFHGFCRLLGLGTLAERSHFARLLFEATKGMHAS
jgi:hypothetical protein